MSRFGFVGAVVVSLCLWSAKSSAQYGACSYNTQQRGYECADLRGSAETAQRYVIVVDKSRDDEGYESSGPRGSLHVVDLAAERVVQTWPVGLGCYRGRKEQQGDAKTPEGSYELLQRRETIADRGLRPRRLGRLFFLTSYPTLNECQAQGYGPGRFGACRRDLGDVVGLHAGRRTEKCTNGCIRLTGTTDNGDDWIKELDRNYVKGGNIHLLIGAKLDSSFYGSQGTLNKCWLARIRDLANSRDHDSVVAMLNSPCIDPPVKRDPPVVYDVPEPEPTQPGQFVEGFGPAEEDEGWGWGTYIIIGIVGLVVLGAIVG